MYQKTQDRGDYLDRVASHATKGSGRGTVWWKVPEPPKVLKRAIPDDLRLEIERLKEVIRTTDKTYKTGMRRAKYAKIALGKIYRNIDRVYGKIDPVDPDARVMLRLSRINEKGRRPRFRR